MFLPENLKFIGYKPVNTMLVISIMGVVCWYFVLWYEAKKDGFNTEKFFDLIFSSVVVSGGILYSLIRLINWLKIFYPSHPLLVPNQEIFLSVTVFLSSLLPIFLFSKKWRWSTFRILDVYALAFSLLLMFLSSGKFLVYGQKEYLILSLLLLSLYLLVLRFRGYKFMSGSIFSIFLIFITAFMLLFFKKNGHLLFSSVLFTISVINLYLRSKKTMAKSSIPQQFIESLRQKLVSKEKSFEREQQALIKEDPYLQPGRDTDNAETMDEVMEDTGKRVTDARLGIVKNMRIQVRKALAAIKLGKYGKCEICGKPIDKARLEAYPEATTCIDCATDASQIDSLKEDEELEGNTEE